MYKCPGCGAALRFDPETQLIKCDHCGTHYDPKDPAFKYLNEAHSQVEVGGANAEYKPDNTFEAHVFMCPNCGAKVLSTDETAGTFCSFCGSNVVLEERLEQEAKPDVVIPFKVSKKACEEAYKKVLSRAIFTPSAMRKDSQIEKFRGIYMPYWIYAYETDGSVTATGETSHRRGDYIITDHYQVTGYVRGEFGGISYDASSSFSDTMSEAVAPFSTAGAEEFNTTYLSGFYADVSDVGAEVYAQDAREVARTYFADEAYRSPEYASHGVSRSDLKSAIRVKDDNNKKGYYPVWFLANRSKNGEYVSYAVVNGQTGKVAADLPVSFKKYILASFLLAIPVGILLYLLMVGATDLSITPKGVLIVMGIMSFIMLLLMNGQIKRTMAKGMVENDRGYRYKMQINGGDAAKPKKPASIWKQVVSIILAIAMVFLGPVSDIPYYLACIVVIVLQIWGVFDLIRLHNMQSRQKPPQFEKRGGDYNA